MIENEQTKRDFAEHDGDEADGADASPPVDRPEARQCRRQGAAHDPDLLRAESLHPHRLGIPRQAADEVEDLLRQSTLGDGLQWRRRVVVQPQAGLVDPEQGECLVDDVAEEAIEIVAAADLRCDPPEGVGTRRPTIRPPRWWRLVARLSGVGRAIAGARASVADPPTSGVTGRLINGTGLYPPNGDSPSVPGDLETGQRAAGIRIG